MAWTAARGGPGLAWLGSLFWVYTVFVFLLSLGSLVCSTAVLFRGVWGERWGKTVGTIWIWPLPWTAALFPACHGLLNPHRK